MAIANPRIHIICGICGNKDMIDFNIHRDYEYVNEGEPNEKMIDRVIVRCGNCDSITDLNEVIDQKEV